jgi:hypothetical protein
MLLLFASAMIAFAQESSLPILPTRAALTNNSVQVFRRLLAMNESEREQFIKSRPSASQPFLRAKVQEFLALDTTERERRLQSLELRALLLPLMSMPAEERSRYVQTLPEDMRKLVEDRLRIWIILPPPLAKDVLENEYAVRFFLDLQTSTNRQELLSSMSPHQKTQLAAGIEKLNQMSPARRDLMAYHVQRLFELDAREREQTLSALSDHERALVTNALARLSTLPAGEREQAVEGLRKFKGLSETEQKQFLRSAERWKALSEKDRQVWRALVAHTRSIMPTSLPPMPPSPEQIRPKRITANSD